MHRYTGAPYPGVDGRVESALPRSVRLFLTVSPLPLSFRLPSLPLSLLPLPSPFHQVCEKSNLMFKSAPRALFITLEDRGRVFR